MISRTKFLSALRGTSWGCSKKLMLNLYRTYIRSVAEYGMAAWFSPSSHTTHAKLEVANNRAARLITGCVNTAPTELLLDEADLIPLIERGKILTGIAYERAMRLPEDNPRAASISVSQRNRLKTQKSWRDEGKNIATKLSLEKYPREKFSPVQSIIPSMARPNVLFRDCLDSPVKRDDNPDKKLAASLETLEKLPSPGIVIYTDGAVGKGCHNAGSGFAAFDYRTGTPYYDSCPAGHIASSYRAEQIALHASLKWLSEKNLEGILEVRICTDSRSLVQALQSGPFRRLTQFDREIWEMIYRIFIPESNRHLTVQWVPGHSGLPGNELADLLAKQGSNLRQENVPIDFNSAKAIIKREFVNNWKKSITHPFYNHKRNAESCKNMKGLSVKEQKIISQLRAGGHSPILKSYQFRIGIADDAICPNCQVEEETVEHFLLHCPAFLIERTNVLGTNISLSILWENPDKVKEFLHTTGKLPGN